MVKVGGFPDSSVGKESDTGDMGLIPSLGRSPGGGKWQAISVFLPEKCHEQRNLAGYSPKDLKELHMIEWLSTEMMKVTQ